MKDKGSLERDFMYQLYEATVQDAPEQVRLADQFYTELNPGKKALVLREDFCGTFKICCEWVKTNPKRRAIGLDLDPEPLSYGRRKHLIKLKEEQQKRITLLQQDVCSTTQPKADAIIGCNFSFNIFKDEETLVKYFRHAKASLAPGGIFSLEQAGGPGMIEEERQKEKHKHGKMKYTYIWDQRRFDPITRDGLYTISFHVTEPGKSKAVKYDDAFVYDWRMWTIPEIRYAMKQAGFKKTAVFWEESTDDEEEYTGDFRRRENAPNDHAWIAFIVGHNV